MADKLLEIDTWSLAYWADNLDDRQTMLRSHYCVRDHCCISERQAFEVDAVLRCDDLFWLVFAQVGQELIR
jgi:hypothetical protein